LFFSFPNLRLKNTSLISWFNLNIRIDLSKALFLSFPISLLCKIDKCFMNRSTVTKLYISQPQSHCSNLNLTWKFIKRVRENNISHFLIASETSLTNITPENEQNIIQFLCAVNILHQSKKSGNCNKLLISIHIGHSYFFSLLIRIRKHCVLF
jgi:hypothetical protein